MNSPYNHYYPTYQLVHDSFIPQSNSGISTNYNINNRTYMNQPRRNIQYQYNSHNYSHSFTIEDLVNLKLSEIRKLYTDPVERAEVIKIRRKEQIRQAVTLWRIRNIKKSLIEEKLELEKEIEMMKNEMYGGFTE
ncbi:hypothetical protein LOD99_14805 [Oopsacas minuta]|uniref:BZIP domain-containing protein n=1 Tax=Oopsacas minuta TaxID=111878 RepID=A0AAV7KDC0_9METZ|nr:hypothetical protein LOD99_14805 [Oopsacas minuta]